MEAQLKWLRRESEEAKTASEAHLNEVLGIAEELRTKKAEQNATIEEIKRLALYLIIRGVPLIMYGRFVS